MKILIVEDEPKVAQFIKNGLEENNYEAEICYDGSLAEQLVEKSNSLVVEDLELDLERKVARRGNVNIDLTAKEFSLLEFFMRNKGRVMSRVDIAEKVWDIKFDSGTNVVDVYVNFLRKKIDKGHDKKLIQTRVGFGYIFGKS